MPKPEPVLWAFLKWVAGKTVHVLANPACAPWYVMKSFICVIMCVIVKFFLQYLIFLDTTYVRCIHSYTVCVTKWNIGAAVVVVVKLLACEARGPGFPSSHRPGLVVTISEIGYLLLPSLDMAERSLKRRKSSKQPTNVVKYITILCLAGHGNLSDHVDFLNRYKNNGRVGSINYDLTFEIVPQEVLWSIWGSHQTLWSLPLPNVTWHSGTWPYTMTPSIDHTLHQFAN